MITPQGYKLVAGYNNAMTLVAVETAFPLYQGKPLIMQGRGTWNVGEEFERADKGLALTGYQVFKWLIPVMGVNQYDFAQDTYCTGGTGQSGKTTARHRSKDDDDTFANYNAMLRLPQQYKLQRKYDAYLGVEIVFIVEAAL